MIPIPMILMIAVIVAISGGPIVAAISAYVIARKYKISWRKVFSEMCDFEGH